MLWEHHKSRTKWATFTSPSSHRKSMALLMLIEWNDLRELSGVTTNYSVLHRGERSCLSSPDLTWLPSAWLDLILIYLFTCLFLLLYFYTILSISKLPDLSGPGWNSVAFPWWREVLPSCCVGCQSGVPPCVASFMSAAWRLYMSHGMNEFVRRLPPYFKHPAGNLRIMHKHFKSISCNKPEV